MGIRARPSALMPAAAAPATCLHCGAKFNGSRGHAFCCSGCEAVYSILQGAGLERYYQLQKLNPPACPTPARVANEDFSFCDDPVVMARFGRGADEIEFFVEGLACSACLWLLGKLPSLCPDVQRAEVNLGTSTVRILRAPGGSFAAAARAMNRLGYRPHLAGDSDSAERLQVQERRRDLIRIGVAGACAGNIMIFATSLYGGADGAFTGLFRWTMAALAVPSLSYCAWPFYKTAWNGLRARTLNLDVPIVAALIAGTIRSAWALYAGEDAIYFDSLAVLVFLLLSSRAWLKSLQRRALNPAHLADSVLVGSVERLRSDGSSEVVSSLSLRAGDRVVIAGDRLIPADGRVEEGLGSVCSAPLTGESEPAAVEAGDEAFAGTRNLDGRWILNVSKPPAESRFAGILKDAEKSFGSMPQIVRLADQVGKAFVGAVLLLAAGTVLAFASASPAEGFSRALALVIVSCPCVFGMAIPLSLSLAMRAAAARGIIVKNADALERLGAVRTVFFDKTGTLTEGKLVSRRMELFGGSLESLAAIQALERGQSHPIARALLDAVAGLGISSARSPEAHDVRIRPGGGIQGVVDGKACSIAPAGPRKASISASEIRAFYEFRQGDELIAGFEIGDEIRPEAHATLARLRARGLGVALLSGDRETIVADVGERLGFAASDVVALASPERKALLLRERGAAAAMVGDGANDAAALAASGVGIAVRGSMDASLKTADVYLMRADLRAIDELFGLAAAARRAIARNLAFSTAFNLAAGSLALTGRMTPLWAAVLMPLSSLAVLASALSAGRSSRTSAERSRSGRIN